MATRSHPEWENYGDIEYFEYFLSHEMRTFNTVNIIQENSTFGRHKIYKQYPNFNWDSRGILPHHADNELLHPESFCLGNSFEVSPDHLMATS